MSKDQVRLAQEYLRKQEETKSYYSSGAADIKRFKVPGNSKVRIRFLPPFDPKKEMFFKQYGMHWNINPAKNSSAYACPRLTKNQKCPICEKAESLRKASKTDPAAKAEYDLLRVRVRFVSNIVDVSSTTSHEDGVQVFAFGPTIQKVLLDHQADEANWGDFTDMAEGFVVNITATGTGQNTKYTVSLDRNFTSFHPDYLNLRVKLDETFKVLSYEELISALEGQDEGEVAPTANANIAPAVQSQSVAAPAPVTPVTSMTTPAPAQQQLPIAQAPAQSAAVPAPVVPAPQQAVQPPAPVVPVPVVPAPVVPAPQQAVQPPAPVDAPLGTGVSGAVPPSVTPAPGTVDQSNDVTSFLNSDD